MGLALDIAKRVAFNRQKSFSRFIIRLSVAATALSVAAMIITLSFVNGFQQKVSEKVFSFWGHIRVQKYEAGKSLVAEETPLQKDPSVENIIRQQPGVTQVQRFATKSVVLEARGYPRLGRRGLNRAVRNEALNRGDGPWRRD